MELSQTDIEKLTAWFVSVVTGGTVTGPIDIEWGGNSLTLGADSGTNTRTDATNKFAKVAAAHYTNAEEPVTLFLVTTTSGTNFMFIGGGTALHNAVSQIQFYTAATTTTLTGTQRMIITSGGNVGIGSGTPTARLHLPAGTATANTAPLKMTDGTLLSTVENGTFEWSSGVLYFTTGGVRKTVQLV